ncbi:MAG: tRNA uridine-5-carboxymethylaminomethyl(34) synthesis GTPase MnmE [bacterium]
MEHFLDDTIVAIATPIGSGGIGVIRVSGADSSAIRKAIFLPSNSGKTIINNLCTGWIVDPVSGEKIDQVMSFFMKGPNSFTGEDVAEFHCHGNPAILQKVIELVIGQGGRLAARGEFTKRAFLNKKLDLAQAEAVLDLVQIPTELGAGLAARQLAGRLSKTVKKLKEKLLKILAQLEAEIDFPDDVEPLKNGPFLLQLEILKNEISELLSAAHSARKLRHGLATVIIGKPNVGKSSLLNLLLGESRAIVSAEPGTTRDTIVELLEVGGVLLRIVDTAGLRRTTNDVEAQGIQRTENELAAADLIIAMFDSSTELDNDDLLTTSHNNGKKCINVLNKCDLPPRINLKQLEGQLSAPLFSTSVIKQHGIAELKMGIAALSGALEGNEGGLILNVRHRDCLTRARAAIGDAEKACQDGLTPDIFAIGIKEAIVALGEVTGELVSEEVINQIFDEFCVGK